jgi:hypothetical protein
MSKDPERCCIVNAAGIRCPNKPMYKIGKRGFCEEHRHHAVAISSKTAGVPTSLLNRPAFYQENP